MEKVERQLGEIIAENIGKHIKIEFRNIISITFQYFHI
jgi:hypothetical protein